MTPKSKQQEELMTNLPSEIIINIISRLPVRSIITCKCVRKSWLNLLNSPDFVKFHLSESKPGLVLFAYIKQPHYVKLFEFDDSLHLENHELHYNPVGANLTLWDFNLPLPDLVFLVGSASGLLFLSSTSHLYICNPITRDYIEIPSPERNIHTLGFGVSKMSGIHTLGFGVSKMSGQQKVVRIFYYRLFSPKAHHICQVYTLGTGSWRTIAQDATLDYDYFHWALGVFLNGNLHWFLRDLKGCYWISHFDLQSELFGTFLPPSYLHEKDGGFYCRLVALGDCLCLCDNTDDEIVIWLTKEYGDEKSWTKEFVFRKVDTFDGEVGRVYPIKVFKDGDILMVWEETSLCYYSNKTKLILRVDLCDRDRHTTMLHTPSFLSLKSFPRENAKSF